MVVKALDIVLLWRKSHTGESAVFILVLLGSIAASIVQTAIWRNLLFIPIDSILRYLFKKAEIIRIILLLLLVLFGDYLVFSLFSVLASLLSRSAQIAFYILSAIFWYFIYGKSAYNRLKYMSNVDYINDSFYERAVKENATRLERSLLSIEFYLIYGGLILLICVAIWPSIGLWR